MSAPAAMTAKRTAAERGAMLRRARELCRMTLGEMAQLVGCRKAILGDIETGRKRGADSVLEAASARISERLEWGYLHEYDARTVRALLEHMRDPESA